MADDGFEDNGYIETEKHTFTAAFVNSEEVEYLVVEDNYTNGRPPLEKGGALFTTRETVDKVETMNHLPESPPHGNEHLRMHAGLHPDLGRDGRPGHTLLYPETGIHRGNARGHRPGSA